MNERKVIVTFLSVIVQKIGAKLLVYIKKMRIRMLIDCIQYCGRND